MTPMTRTDFAHLDYSRLVASPHATLAATFNVPEPTSPQTPLSEAVWLYEQGEPPPSRAGVTEMYQYVCGDAERSRVRRRAYENGDDVARRQACYCAESLPCSANPDCTDLVVCFPQLVRGEASGSRNASLWSWRASTARSASRAP
jgi:hypothetical protein